MNQPNYKEMIKAYPSPFNVRDNLQALSVEEVRDVQKKGSFNLEVAAFNVTGDLNLGNMIRTSTLMGAKAFHVMGRRTYDRRSTVGAENYIELHYAPQLVKEDGVTFDREKVKEYFEIRPHLIPVFIEQGGNLLGHSSNKFNRDFIQYIDKKDKTNLSLCIIMGNEGQGIQKDLLDLYPVWGIPQYGVLRSHNVGVTLGIVLWEITSMIIGYR